MEKSKKNKKIYRKQNRCRNILKKHENLDTVDFPTKNIFVGNAGLVCGTQREMLMEIFRPFGVINDIVMVPDKPYSFVQFESKESAESAMAQVNGKNLGDDSSVVLYLCYVTDVPKVSALQDCLPEGLLLIKDFVTENEEHDLLNNISFDSGADTGVMKHRKVKHFGYEFNYTTNNVDKTALLEKIPASCLNILSKLLALGHISRIPNQLTVNQYEPGQGIPPHIDTHSAFEDEIISLSLGSQVVMDFYHPLKKEVPVVLPQRSVLIMKGESRYLWKHGITPRKNDMIPVFGKDGCHLTLSPRKLRTSFTFRSVREGSCNCVFSKVCDSQSSFAKTNGQSIEGAEFDAKEFEARYVTQVYDSIAEHFSCTRYKPWPLVMRFIQDIPVGSILIDAGCGNGKNMTASSNVFQVGCDVSMNLLNVCAEKKLQVIGGDVLNLPFRDGCADACICIAVIHHMATEERRLQAVKEMTRVLRPSGRGLIYVWALEQETSNGSSNYLSYRKVAEKGTKSSEEFPVLEPGLKNIAIHENRTHFVQQDVLVPWHKKTKDGEVHHRFYHVFKDGELSSLVASTGYVQILSSYYDQGNWCVLFQK